MIGIGKGRGSSRPVRGGVGYIRVHVCRYLVRHYTHLLLEYQASLFGCKRHHKRKVL